MRLLMKAKNENQVIDFELNTRLCDSEVEMAASGNPSDVFDSNNPEGPYSLNLAKVYD